MDLKQERDRLFPRRNRLPDQWAAFISEKYRPPRKRTDKPATNRDHNDIKQRPPVSTFEKFKIESELLVEKKIVDELRLTTDKFEKIREQNSELQRRNNNLQIKLNTMKQYEKKSSSIKLKNQTIKRKEQAIAKWKSKFFALKKAKARQTSSGGASVKEDIQTRSRKLGQRLRAMKCRAKLKNKENVMLKAINESMETWDIKVDCEYEEKIQILSNRIKELEQEAAMLKNPNEAFCHNPKVIQTKVGKTYSDSLRKCVFYMLQSQVPVEKVGNVLQFTVCEMSGHELSEIPSVTTVCRIAREMGVISDIQSGESAILSKSSLTLGWDSTPIDGTHVNETHLCTPSGNLTLSLAELPGGKTQDYHSAIAEALDNVITSYSEFVGLNKSDIESTLYKNISSTISDRAVVNHCVVEKLAETFGQQLIELNCNLHPVDGIAGSARKTLKLCEVEGAVFGKEAAVVNFIASLCKMRYKAGTGDPGGFKHFMNKHNMPLKTVPRYVGNRLHILFELASVFYVHRQKFHEYLLNFCPATNGLRTALLKDITNTHVIEHLQLLGMYGRKLTGPWLKMFYSKDGENHHLSILEPLKICIQNLEGVVSNGNLLHQMDTDMFSNQLDQEDGVLQGRLLVGKMIALVSSLLD